MWSLRLRRPAANPDLGSARGRRKMFNKLLDDYEDVQMDNCRLRERVSRLESLLAGAEPQEMLRETRARPRTLAEVVIEPVRSYTFCVLRVFLLLTCSGKLSGHRASTSSVRFHKYHLLAQHHPPRRHLSRYRQPTSIPPFSHLPARHHPRCMPKLPPRPPSKAHPKRSASAHGTLICS
jgi:hypothetical protein